MDELAFVYGTLRDPKVQTEIIGRLVEGSLKSGTEAWVYLK